MGFKNDDKTHDVGINTDFYKFLIELRRRLATHTDREIGKLESKSTYDLENVYDVLPVPIDPDVQHVQPFESLPNFQSILLNCLLSTLLLY